METPDTRPIGIFDSGFGGLTVMRELLRHLPNEHFIYLGDTAHLPYGSKSPDTVIRYTLDCASFFSKKNIKALVIACHTASCHALGALREKFSMPVISVMESAAKLLKENASLKQIAILATTGTISSGVYQRLIAEQCPQTLVHSIACPLFVPLVEEGLSGHGATALIVDHYLAHLREKKVDAAILACTHYPLLRALIQQTLGQDTRLIDPAEECALETLSFLTRRQILGNQARSEFFATDCPGKFRFFGTLFLGHDIEQVERLNIEKNWNL